MKQFSDIKERKLKAQVLALNNICKELEAENTRLKKWRNLWKRSAKLNRFHWLCSVDELEEAAEKHLNNLGKIAQLKEALKWALFELPSNLYLLDDLKTKSCRHCGGKDGCKSDCPYQKTLKLVEG